MSTDPGVSRQQPHNDAVDRCGPPIATSQPNPSQVPDQKPNTTPQSSPSLAAGCAINGTWGINWRKPTFIVSILLCGLFISLGHHFYYLSLKGSPAGDSSKQAWPIRFGTSFAFIFVACCKGVTATSLGQYIWALVKRTPLRVRTLDTLYSLSSDPFGMLNPELFNSARVALFLSLVFWCLGLTGVLPPATLSVIARNLTVSVAVPTLDFSKTSWGYGYLPVPGEYWSYDLHFFGPSVQCKDANTTEQAVFNQITGAMELQEGIFTFQQVDDQVWNETVQPGLYEESVDGTINRILRLVYSAWTNGFMAVEYPNKWMPSCPPISTVEQCNWPLQYWPYVAALSTDYQLWVQTADSSIVCSAVNASFDITIASVKGEQYITHRAIRVIGSYELSNFSSRADFNHGGFSKDQTVLWSPYLTHYVALAGLLSGNVTLPPMLDTFGENISVFDTSSVFDSSNGCSVPTPNFLATGLIACDEIQNSPFKNYILSPTIGNQSEAFTNTFPAEPWMCRNRSLARAIEDLSNNITISYLSSPLLTNSESEFRDIVTSNTINVYEYHPMYLLLSYGIGLLCAAVAAIVGLLALRSNGVSHSTSFSAIVATTRNPRLDGLTSGHSLGAEPLHTNFKNSKLRLGPLLEMREEKSTGVMENGAHVAFGFEDQVGVLKRGDTYT